MLSFLRGANPPRTNNATNNPVVYEAGTSSVHYHAAGSSYMMTHTIPPTHPTAGASIIQPPFHFHIYQSEKFHVRSGTGNFYFGLDAKPSAVLTGDDQEGPSSSGIANLRYHRFENASETVDLVIDIQLDPEEYENEQRFFRNFFGYLDDCKQKKMAPSVFQLFVFLHSADTPLAVPMPFQMEAVGIWVSRALLIAVAGVGRWVLGYQETYSEYYDSSKSK